MARAAASSHPTLLSLQAAPGDAPSRRLFITTTSAHCFRVVLHIAGIPLLEPTFQNIINSATATQPRFTRVHRVVPKARLVLVTGFPLNDGELVG